MNFKTFKLVRGFYKHNMHRWNLSEKHRNYLISRLVDGEFVAGDSKSPKLLMRLDALDAIIAEVQRAERTRIVKLIWDAKKVKVTSLTELQILVEVES